MGWVLNTVWLVGCDCIQAMGIPFICLFVETKNKSAIDLYLKVSHSPARGTWQAAPVAPRMAMRSSRPSATPPPPLHPSSSPTPPSVHPLPS